MAPPRFSNPVGDGFHPTDDPFHDLWYNAESAPTTKISNLSRVTPDRYVSNRCNVHPPDYAQQLLAQVSQALHTQMLYPDRSDSHERSQH